MVSKPLDQLLIHNSDSAVKPIIGNKQIQKPLDCKYDPSCFRFKPLSAQQISQKIQQKITQEFFSQIYQAVGTCPNITEKLSILAYFQSIITGSSVANNLINSPFLTLIVKTLRTARSLQLKLRLCSILGQLTRHSTVIENQAAEVGICSVLIDLIKVEKNQKVRRKGMAALGEYLFYAATQLDDKDADDVWQIPSSAILLLVNLLKPSQDQTVRFYVSKTIQNITAQSQKAGHQFATQEILNQLMGIYSSNSKNDNFKTSATVAICNVCRLEPQLLGSFFEQMAFGQICSGLSDGSPRVQQALVTILNQALYNTQYHELVCKSLSEQRVFLTALAKLLEHSNVVIRGKTLLTFLLLFKTDWKWMIVVNEIKFYSLLDRLIKDNYKYIQCCLVAVLQTLTNLVPPILHKVKQDFSRLIKGSYPKSPPDTALQRYTQEVLNSHKSDYSNLKGQLIYLTIVYDLLNANSLKHRVFTAELIQTMVQFLERFEQPQNSPQNDEFRRLVFAILQTLGACNQKALINHHGPILTLLMPSLLKRLKQHNADTRFHSLKIFINIITIYLNQDSIYEVGSTKKSTTKQLNQIILKQLLQNYGIILTDQDPVPLYGLKLLHVIIERNPDFIGVLKKIKVLTMLSEYFIVGHNRFNMHTIRIVRSISESKDVGIDELLGYDLFEKVKMVLKNMVNDYRQDWCNDALLDILYNLAMRTFETIKHHNQNPQEQQVIVSCFNQFLLMHIKCRVRHKCTVQQIAQLGIIKFAPKWSLTLTLQEISPAYISYQNIVDKAAQTLYLIFQLYHALKQKLNCQINLSQEHIHQLQNGLRNDKSYVQRRVLRCLHWAFSNIDDHKISFETRQTITKTVSQLVNSEDKNTASTAREFQKYLQQI